jgi:heptosyltransferase-2
MKIALIKLGADGDVLRTIPLAKSLKEHYPDSKLTWITRGDIATLLKGLPYIDKIHQASEPLTESFDRLYNFDIDEEASHLTLTTQAKIKKGFYREAENILAFNLGAEYYVNTIYDDMLKKNNKKTYQQMMFDAAELPISSERYELALTKEDKAFAQEFAKAQGLPSAKCVGIHMGASARWPSKAWAETRIREFIEILQQKGYGVLLLGGPNEIERLSLFKQTLQAKGISVAINDPRNTKRAFASIVNLCDTIVCSDSLALHVSLGLGKKTLGLFFCTSPDEVEGYGLLTKLVAPRLYEFFPEKSDQYDRALTESISAKQVYDALIV